MNSNVSETSPTRPSERFAGSAGFIDLDCEAAELLERAKSSPHARAERTLYRHQGVTIAMFAFQESASLPSHAADGVVSVQVLTGRVRIAAGDESFTLSRGQLLRMVPKLTHDLHAEDSSVVLVQIART